MKIVESILTKSDCWRSARRIRVRGLMLHSVGVNQPDAKVFVESWNRQGIQTCVHAFIDGNDGTIYKTLPWELRGWHAGTGTSGKSANNTHIGVEMCEPRGIKYTGRGSTFIITDEIEARRSAMTTYYSAVELFAHLCQLFNLNPITDIISHREGYIKGIASNHADPEHLWDQLDLNFTMNGFREEVKEVMELSEIEKRYHTIEEVPNYAKEAIQYYIDAKALNGDASGDLDLSKDMVRTLTIIYRTFGNK